MTVRHDDPVKIPREQVRFISDQVGYVFMLYHYGVTVDGGVTWFVWYAPKDLPNWRQTRPTIDNIRLLPDGTGTMALRSSTDQPAPELHTSDFGSTGTHDEEYRGEGGPHLAAADLNRSASRFW